MFVHLAVRNIIGMMTGTALAFLLIFLLLVFALHSLRLGLTSLIPNIALVMDFLLLPPLLILLDKEKSGS